MTDAFLPGMLDKAVNEAQLLRLCLGTCGLKTLSLDGER